MIAATDQDLGKEVALQDVESELYKLWEGDEARTNASLVNFAIYSEEQNSLKTNAIIARDLTRENSCRVLLVGMDLEAKQSNIRVWITAHCHLAHGRKSVCSEQVAFALSGKIKGRMNNVVFSHLNSDLPLVFWWQGDLSQVFSRALYKRVDRLIVDSSSWKNPKNGFEVITQAIAEESLKVQDLAWTRTYYFRLGIASLYDDLTAQDALEGITTVKIHVDKNHQFTGLYLLAWFAHQAGWQRSQDLLPDGGELNSYRFQKRNGELVDVEITYTDTGGFLELFEASSSEVTVSLIHAKGDDYLKGSITSPGSEMVIHGIAGKEDESSLVGLQLSRGSDNSLFKSILPQFRNLL